MNIRAVQQWILFIFTPNTSTPVGRRGTTKWSEVICLIQCLQTSILNKFIIPAACYMSSLATYSLFSQHKVPDSSHNVTLKYDVMVL